MAYKHEPYWKDIQVTDSPSVVTHLKFPSVTTVDTLHVLHGSAALEF